MEDDFSCVVISKDERNRRRYGRDVNKRYNFKESARRNEQMEIRSLQSRGIVEESEDIKEEFDEINQAYIRRLKKMQKLEVEAKKNEEKKTLFETDFLLLAVGPEPKQEYKKKAYEEKVQRLVTNKPKKETQGLQVNASQRSALLSYMMKVI